MNYTSNRDASAREGGRTHTAERFPLNTVENFNAFSAVHDPITDNFNDDRTAGRERNYRR